ncbi:MAG: glutamate-1-semialdehyde 2,1-aminomutase [Hyphomonadaceae bacterium]|nr:glutamate-1-semialdehyde 2,1-aminomutase [Clostridia bacterium]
MVKGRVNMNSKQYFDKAQSIIPGGVNSPVRAFRSVGLTPPFIEKAQGANIWDVDGNCYIDYVCSWGPAILGHAHPQVVQAICETAQKGTSFGAPCPLEITLAEMICEAVPSIEMVRMVSSGTEAVMSAIRVARGFTGRELVVKFEGCYHGHADGMLVKAGSGVLTLGEPDSAGVPKGVAACTLTLPYNDEQQLAQLFEKMGEQIAAVIIEPIAGNMGVVPPNIAFLQRLRTLTTQYSSVLIFDEVISGFRAAYGGAQAYYGITPDLTTLGKIIGGGLPVGAYGGKKAIMQCVAPLGAVYQAGTLSGNPVAMAAGIKTLSLLRDQPEIYQKLAQSAVFLTDAYAKAAKENGIALQINRVGGVFSVFFTDQPVTDYESAKTSDTARFEEYFKGMLARGIYLAPSQFEAVFLSDAHTQQQLEQTAQAIYDTFKEII